MSCSHSWEIRRDTAAGSTRTRPLLLLRASGRPRPTEWPPPWTQIATHRVMQKNHLYSAKRIAYTLANFANN